MVKKNVLILVPSCGLIALNCILEDIEKSYRQIMLTWTVKDKILRKTSLAKPYNSKGNH